ncbi:hypothetical protein J4G33_06305 [Actinotalea sp. BY-33]|uniref:DUF1023 domain-containing protein n=1 Tax=Actinotalea soli TaxID=2819234 RepID=A0A939LU90_9CELL|nr:alpha/beta hydrolase [Actinotalea soli]MBO1751412.1 hypothetical protein [Actinotalea soli]
MSAIDTVLSWRPDDVAAIADALVQHRRSLLVAEDELTRSQPPTTWVSTSREPARRVHDRLGRDLSRMAAEAGSVAAAADDAAATLRAAQAELESALEWASGQGFRVDRSTGAVSDIACWEPEVARDRDIAIAEIADRIAQAVRAAQHADATLAAALDGVAQSDGPLVSASDVASVPPMPEGASPGEANAWWRSMSEEQQAWVLAEHPEWLGNTDGIPAGIRDQANRALIDTYRSELEAEAERLRANLDSNWFGGTFTNDDAALKIVEEKLAGLDAIEEVLSRGGRQLLVLDPTGARQLMAAVAVGDVDSADHVAVFTPGFTSTVGGSMASYDRDMEKLARVARDESLWHGDGGTVATVSWLGYEAPQWSEWHRPGSDFVTSQDSANTGGAALADFYRGIDASRPVNPNLTALGHSYGSTTTGVALQESTGVDSAVIFGSPGIATGDVTDLQVPSGQVFQLEADWDGVADLGRFGGDPSRMDGLRSLSTDESQMDGATLNRSTGHSAYLTQDTTSQHNIAAVVVGAEDRMIEVDR